MSQIRLINQTGGTSRIGYTVKLAIGKTNAFMYATLGDSGIVGTVAEIKPNGASTLINPINTVNWVDVQNRPDIVFSPTAPTAPKLNTIWINTSN